MCRELVWVLVGGWGVGAGGWVTKSLKTITENSIVAERVNIFGVFGKRAER